MTDKLLKDRARGDNAKRILEDPLVIEFFDKVENAIEDGWKNTIASDKEARNNAYLMHRLFGNFKGAFEMSVRNGEFAKKELLRINDPLLSKVKRKLHV